MLRGGGCSHVWKVSCSGMGSDWRSNSCWSWMVELLKAFLMVMSWRDTEGRTQEKMMVTVRISDFRRRRRNKLIHINAAPILSVATRTESHIGG